MVVRFLSILVGVDYWLVLVFLLFLSVMFLKRICFICVGFCMLNGLFVILCSLVLNFVIFWVKELDMWLSVLWLISMLCIFIFESIGINGCLSVL